MSVLRLSKVLEIFAWMHCNIWLYSLVQWNWFPAVTGCTWVTCISDVREPISLHQAVQYCFTIVTCKDDFLTKLRCEVQLSTLVARSADLDKFLNIHASLLLQQSRSQIKHINVTMSALNNTSNHFGILFCYDDTSNLFGILFCSDDTSNHFGILFCSDDTSNHFGGILCCSDNTRNHFGILFCSDDTSNHFGGILYCSDDTSNHFGGILYCSNDTSNHFGILFCSNDTSNHFGILFWATTKDD